MNPVQHFLKIRFASQEKSLRILSKAMLVICFLCFQYQVSQAQEQDNTTDTLSKFDRFNKKAEKLFKIIPVPIISYSSDAGNTFGLAKFNAFHLNKTDTISKPSKISGVGTISTKGRVNVSLSNDLVFKENKYIILSYFNFKKQPEYLLGIGNDVSVDSIESVTTSRIKFYSNAMRMIAKDIYVGVSIDVSDYYDVQPDSNSFLIRDDITGVEGGLDVGLGVSFALDKRDNRYNAHTGAFAICNLAFYEPFWGSKYKFTRFDLDVRKYFTPWLKHVIAMQTTTTALAGEVPFYDLALLGGEDKMRGYYKGALRDKVLVDAQVEYRMPVWNIFGIVGWIGTGEVADKYQHLSLNGLWLSYGGGIRVRVDSGNDINMRFDMGFGPKGVSGMYINFSEAF